MLYVCLCMCTVQILRLLVIMLSLVFGKSLVTAYSFWICYFFSASVQPLFDYNRRIRNLSGKKPFKVYNIETSFVFCHKERRFCCYQAYFQTHFSNFRYQNVFANNDLYLFLFHPPHNFDTIIVYIIISIFEFYWVIHTNFVTEA